jgi:acyl transferase domain-containing protein
MRYEKEAMNVKAGQSGKEPIAIIGMSCRFPGAETLEGFWRLLCEGRDAVTEIPADRWDINALYDPDPTAPGKMLTRYGSFLEGLDQFDTQFFGISPREAAHLDPRQRLMLELTWEGLEDAGVPPDSLAGSRTGVFIAILTDEYAELLYRDINRCDIYTGLGSAHSIVANRISYFLDLHGPSLALDTACAGSLVAVRR